MEVLLPMKMMKMPTCICFLCIKPKVCKAWTKAATSTLGSSYLLLICSLGYTDLGGKSQMDFWWSSWSYIMTYKLFLQHGLCECHLHIRFSRSMESSKHRYYDSAHTCVVMALSSGPSKSPVLHLGALPRMTIL